MSALAVSRILIADADPGLRRQVQKRLLEATLSADCVTNGDEAIDLLHRQRYGVVLLDVGLPYGGAERVLEVIRGVPADERPVVLVVAERSAARSLDVDLVQIVLRKPCDLTQLADLVRSCVRTAVPDRDIDSPSAEQAIAV